MRIDNQIIMFLKHKVSIVTAGKNTSQESCKNSSLIKRYFLFLLLFTLIPVLHNTTVWADSEDQKVFDNYGLFSEKEVNKLEEASKKYGEEGKVDIIVITTDDLSGKSRKEYLEDYYDEYKFGYEKEFGTAVLLLLNMDPGDRGIEIQGYGNAQHYIHNDRIEHMLDDIIALLQNEKYYKAMESYMKQVAYYMNQEKGVNTSPIIKEKDSGEYYGEASIDGSSDYYEEKEESILNNIFVQLGISVVIGAVSVGIMAYHSSGRVTVTSRTYLDERNSKVVSSRDDYIRTTTTRVKKPSNDNHTSGGGGIRSSGGGGVSRGGHSHSGGGRSF